MPNHYQIMEKNKTYHLTEYAHGAGCGCKIAPQVLDSILQSNTIFADQNLLVGNESKDDAAVYRINNEEAIISTVDYFMPIVNDAFTFGQVAAANALSDVYAMGGKPLMALGILGWPVERIPAEIAARVLEGAREICKEAGITLAGGHSIDSPEPFFGLSVNGMVKIINLKKNNTAKEGDLIFITKPIGVGILSTALKRKQILPEHEPILFDQLTKLNSIGMELSKINGVHAMTDVTGFGLLGHLIEMAEGSNLQAEIYMGKIPLIKGVSDYQQQQILPDATFRNWNAYKDRIQLEEGVNFLHAFQLLPDPQTNGGLLIAVSKNSVEEVQKIFKINGYDDFLVPIGMFTSGLNKTIHVNH